MLTKLLIALAIAMAPFSALANEQAERDFGDQLDRIFERSEISRAFFLTCIKYTIKEDDLEKFVLEGRTFLPYSEDQAKEFLHGWSGRAWGFRMAKSAYVLTLTDNGICAVNAERANRATTASDMKSLLDTLFKGGAIPIKTTAEAARPIAAWYVDHPRVQKQYSFSAIAGTGEDPPAEAVYSVQVRYIKAP